MMEQLVLEGKHWQLEAVEFFDVTDRFNTLVRPVRALSYRDCLYRGNLLFAENTEKEAGFFMLRRRLLPTCSSIIREEISWLVKELSVWSGSVLTVRM